MGGRSGDGRLRYRRDVGLPTAQGTCGDSDRPVAYRVVLTNPDAEGPVPFEFSETSVMIAQRQPDSAGLAPTDATLVVWKTYLQAGLVSTWASCVAPPRPAWSAWCDPLAGAIRADWRRTPMPREFAVIGCGSRANIGLNIPRIDPDAKVTVAVDPYDDGQARARELFGDEVRLYTDVDQMLAAETDLAGALITSPDCEHAEQAEKTLRAGIPTYLEKPMAIHTEDADRLLAVAAETGTRLFVGHNMRFMGVVSIMKKLIDEGAIGPVRAIWCRHFVGFGADAYFRDWHVERRYGNTLLLQKGAHDIDVIHYLAGAYTERVQAFGALAVFGDTPDKLPSKGLRYSDDRFPMNKGMAPEITGLNAELDMEDLAQVNMVLEGGILASYQQCHFTPDYWRNYTVIGDLGRLENFGDGEGGVVKVWNQRVNMAYEADREIAITGDYGGHTDADLLIMTEFLAYAAGEIDQTRVQSVAARNAVATAVAAAESMRNGGVPIDVPKP
ncbi:Gfo/Idh/MocA family protein [Aestuariimicrobium ganziense]|uniref:Gfo/Idh/MocA family protein n=1 Tax=Aestuariimicrobium ganziense TaxID=2773677 RepID=UPI0019434724|nr:Gfo/Idh/MocA family oxidoreductase [Aestuariimicrobium ganziense]